ncbi:hypothetical protein PYCCODRAFT_1084146 [Trametes coccinea BRFM310]|uniref:Uncharacterized protein n=1 Tax=Trametes coccinea (strain BRFM310) TaxID=1353009 RepID=A0A1Y2J1S3_TRAC3|nr:hypothetical protein PYCCODRAFT_1084146 [Trametes coccinea BRFM310]
MLSSLSRHGFLSLRPLRLAMSKPSSTNSLPDLTCPGAEGPLFAAFQSRSRCAIGHYCMQLDTPMFQACRGSWAARPGDSSRLAISSRHHRKRRCDTPRSLHHPTTRLLCPLGACERGLTVIPMIAPKQNFRWHDTFAGPTTFRHPVFAPEPAAARTIHFALDDAQLKSALPSPHRSRLRLAGSA